MRWTYKPWRERTHAERVQFYTAWSLYPLSALPPVVFALQLLLRESAGWPDWALLVPYLAHTVLCMIMLHHTLARSRIDRRLAAAQVLLGVVLLVGLALVRQPIEQGFVAAPVLAQGFVVVGTATSWAPALRARGIWWLGVGCGVVLSVVQLPAGPGFVVLFGFPLAILGLVWLSIYGTSAWFLRVVQELAQAREAAARLAVAEERLRFSRDLHDVFGRVLATVAIKSELAAELTSRRPEDAAATMLEVRQLAQDSLTEVRAVAAGYRRADLGNELRGARALLDSAGVGCTVLGEELDLPDRARTAFGWVVREAVTNVIRHSTATACTISLSRDPGSGRLEVVNNGAGEPSPGGSGLAGLAERLAPLGGRLETVREDDTFTLRVTLPIEDRP